MKKVDFTILNRKIAIKERSNNFLTNDRTHVNNTTIEREFHSRHRGIAFFAIENFILLIYQAWNIMQNFDTQATNCKWINKASRSILFLFASCSYIALQLRCRREKWCMLDAVESRRFLRIMIIVTWQELFPVKKRGDFRVFSIDHRHIYPHFLEFPWLLWLLYACISIADDLLSWGEIGYKFSLKIANFPYSLELIENLQA